MTGRPHHSMFTSKTPHFFQVILHETIQDGMLGIPIKFTRAYGNQLSSHVKLEVPSGAIWPVELTNTDGTVRFHKGWSEFAKHYSLEVGSFVVFRYQGNDHFHVLVFDKSATEIEYACSTIEEDDVSACRKNKEKTDLPCPLPRKKRSTDSKFENISSQKIELVIDPNKNENSHSSIGQVDGVGALSACKNVKTEVLRCSQNLTAAEKARAVEIAGALENTKNPFFMLFMRPSSVTSTYKMVIPLDFARKYLTMRKCNLTLCNSAGKTWLVAYYWKAKTAQLYGGWQAFVEDNNLNVGDICVFELIKHPEILLKVIIYPVVEDASIACRLQDHKSTASRVRTRSLVNDTEPDCQHTRCKFKCSAKPLNPTEKRRAAGSASRSSSRLVSRKNKEKSHLPCPLPQKKMRTYLPTQPGTSPKLAVLSSCISHDDSTSSRISLESPKNDEKPSGQLDADRNVNTGVLSCSRKLTDTEKAHTVQLASAFKSNGNPVFLVVMQPSYVCKPNRIWIPLDFARKFLPVNNCDLTLVSLTEKTWPVKYVFNADDKRPQAILCGGWQAFVEDNHLSVGDTCVFELIKDPEILMKVVINPVVKNARKAYKQQAYGSIAGRVKIRNLVTNIEPNCQQSSFPSSPRKIDAADSYIKILDDSPLNHKTKKKLASSSFEPCKVMRTKRSESIQANRIRLEKEKKSMSSQYLTKELGTLGYSPKDDRERMSIDRRCLKPELTRKIKMEPLTLAENQRAHVGASGCRTSNPSFSVVIHPPSYPLCIPEAFAKRYLQKSGEMILRVPDGRTWTVEYDEGSEARSRSFECNSWRKFAEDNELKVGDVCILELMNETGNLLAVVIQRKLLLIEID